MAEWFIIDTRTGQIVNACTTSRPGGPDLTRYLHGNHYVATMKPTEEQLRGYKYYWKRP